MMPPHIHVDTWCTKNRRHRKNRKYIEREVCLLCNYIQFSSLFLFHFPTFLKAALRGCGHMPIFKPFPFCLNQLLIAVVTIQNLYSSSPIFHCLPLSKFSVGSTLSYLIRILQHPFCSPCRIASFSVFL